MARGIVTLLEHKNAKNDDFNLSTSVSTTVLELANLIFSKIRPNENPNFKFIYGDVRNEELLEKL